MNEANGLIGRHGSFWIQSELNGLTVHVHAHMAGSQLVSDMRSGDYSRGEIGGEQFETQR